MLGNLPQPLDAAVLHWGVGLLSFALNWKLRLDHGTWLRCHIVATWLSLVLIKGEHMMHHIVMYKDEEKG